MIILGIDPGIRCAGYAIIKHTNRGTVLLGYGTITGTYKESIAIRLSRIYDTLSECILKYQVTHIGIETPFLGNNASSYLKLGYVRGIVYLLSQQRDVSLSEFAPRVIKKAITSWGGAPKEQVARVVYRLFPSLKEGVGGDVTDAIAIALITAWKA